MKKTHYELEYRWGKTRIKGDVEVRTQGTGVGFQYHFLSVNGKPIARYVRHRKDGVWDEGKTILDDGLKTIGKGNLLAGVLLTEAVRERRESKTALREHFPELFSAKRRAA